MTENTTRTTISRTALHGSRRLSQEGTPLLRGETSGQVDDQTIDIPVPGTFAEQPDTIRVLHVDDNPNYGDLTRTILERTADRIEVTTETNALASLDGLRAGKFDCVVSDYEMPNTDGLEFLEIVREEHPDLPFILFTGKGGEEIASEAISAGVTDYVRKKGSTEQYQVLANRITNAVERYHTQQRFWDALAWYQQLVTQGLAGVFMVQNGQFVYVNQRFASVLGYDQEALLGATPSILDTDSVSRPFSSYITENGDCDEPVEVDLLVAGADGTDLPVAIHAGAVSHAGESGCLGVLWAR